MGRFSEAFKYVFLGTTGLVFALIIEFVVSTIAIAIPNLPTVAVTSMFVIDLVLYFASLIMGIYGYVLLYTAIHDYNKEVQNIGTPWSAILGLLIPIIGYPLLYNVLSRLDERLKTPAKLLLSSIFIAIFLIILSFISLAYFSMSQSSLDFMAILIYLVLLITGFLFIVIAWGWIYIRAKKIGL